MTDQDYARLRAAVLAYDRAIRAYGLLGQAWVEHSDELDRLYQDMIDATQPNAGSAADQKDENS